MKTPDPKLLELDRLWKTYDTPKGPATIVKDFSLRLREGEFATLIGHSGCGKSTVLLMVAGLTDVSSGGIILSGKEVTGAGPDRGVVFQAPCLLPWFTAFENVMLGIDQVYYTADREERRQIAEYYLCVVGLADATSCLSLLPLPFAWPLPSASKLLPLPLLPLPLPFDFSPGSLNVTPSSSFVVHCNLKGTPPMSSSPSPSCAPPPPIR